MTQTPPESEALFTAEQVIAMVQKMNASLGGKVAKVEIVPASGSAEPKLKVTMGDGTAAELGIPQQDVASLQESIRQAVTGITVTDDGEMTIAKGDDTTATYQLTKALIPDGPITITETAEGIKIGSTVTGGGGEASPSGTGDDTAIIRQALTGAITLGPGDFYYKGTGEPFNYNNLAGVAGRTNIIMPTGGYLLTLPASESFQSLAVSGITFKGGSGAIKVDSTIGNGTARAMIENCEFFDYTGSAITKGEVDLPHWTIRNCTFRGTGAGSMGVALMGAVDNTQIVGNKFQNNAIAHIKIGDAGQNATIRDNDFVRFSTTDGTNRANIWVVPNASANRGWNFLIDHNKHGNENQIAGDFRILIADEDMASGTSFGTRRPKLAASTSYAVGITIRSEGVWSAVTPAPPLVTSYVSDWLRSLTVEGTFHTGWVPADVLHYAGGLPTANWGVTVQGGYDELGNAIPASNSPFVSSGGSTSAASSLTDAELAALLA